MSDKKIRVKRGEKHYFKRIRKGLNTGEIERVDNNFCRCKCGQIIRFNSFYTHVSSKLHYKRLLEKEKGLRCVIIKKDSITNYKDVKIRKPEFFKENFGLGPVGMGRKNYINDYDEIKKIELKLALDKKEKISQSIKRDENGRAVVSFF